MKYDVYVAGPFFRPHQVESMERLESVLEKHGFKMFKPRFDSIHLGPDSSAEDRQQAFEEDLEAIHESKFIISNTLDKDMGTVFETGYAFANYVPIVGFVEGLPKEAPFNVMLAGSMRAVFTSAEGLGKFIEGKKGKDGFLEWLKSGDSVEFEGAVE